MASFEKKVNVNPGIEQAQIVWGTGGEGDSLIYGSGYRSKATGKEYKTYEEALNDYLGSQGLSIFASQEGTPTEYSKIISTDSNGRPTVARYNTQGDLVGFMNQQGGTQYYFDPQGQVTNVDDVAGGNFITDTVLKNPAIMAALTAGVGSAAGASIGSTLAPEASSVVQQAIGKAAVQGALSGAAGGDVLKGALGGGLGALGGSVVAPAIAEAAGGGMLGSAIGQGVTSAGLAALQGGDVTQALLSGAASGASSYTPAAVGINSQLTPAQIEAGIGTPGYGTGAAAQSSGLFDPSVIGSNAYTQTSYPVDMAEFAGADALQLMKQGIGVPAVEQNLVSSGIDPLIAADLTQQISFNPNVSSTDLANKLISTYGSNIYDTPVEQTSSASKQETPKQTNSNVNYGAIAKGLLGLLGANMASNAFSGGSSSPQSGMSVYQPSNSMPAYSPEYFKQIQQYYNSYLPTDNTDVTTPLAQWYNKTGA